MRLDGLKLDYCTLLDDFGNGVRSVALSFEGDDYPFVADDHLCVDAFSVDCGVVFEPVFVNVPLRVVDAFRSSGVGSCDRYY